MKLQKEHKQEPVRKESRLSGLYAYRQRLKDWVERKTKVVTVIQQDIEEKQQKLARVENRISIINNREMFISSHALLRFRQRIDPHATEETMRARVCTPRLLEQVKVLGNGTYPVEDFHVIIADNKIVTIISPDK